MREILQQLAEGGDPQQALLHNCLFLAGTVDAYGRDAILELLRCHPSVAPIRAVVSKHSAALFATAETSPIALFADRYDRRISRLWYLAHVPLSQSNLERVDVPFDHRLGALGDSRFDAGAHPDLSAIHVRRIESLLMHVNLDGLERTSGFAAKGKLSQPSAHVVRAFSDGNTAAVLLTLTALRNDGVPALLQFPVAALMESDSMAEALWIIDNARLGAELARAWQPEL